MNNEADPGVGWFDGAIGDLVDNEYGDGGEVLRVTPNWVLVDDGADGRWVHRDKFEAGDWWVA